MSQVRHLIQGIKINQFDAFNDLIMVTAYLRTDYNGCVSLYNTFINHSKKVSPTQLNISRVESSNHKGGGHKKHKGGSGGSVEDVQYFKEEYKALYSDRREALYKNRQSRVNNPADKKFSSKGGDATDKLVNQVSTLVAVMKSAPEAPGTNTPSKNCKIPAFCIDKAENSS